MIKNLKKLIAVFALSVALVSPLAVVSTSSAQITENLCSGVDISAPSASGSCDQGSGEDGVVDAVQTVVNWLSWFVGIVSVIMIVVGGFKYITSGGASDKVTGAKNTIIYAIIGLVIVALAQFIVRFVVSRAGEVV